ncbi:MAG: hypothetical protein P4L28_08010 [Paludibacteraceae bacterium]|nr:hypothetical protein [Paludibacteraceae bacterium]
MSKKTQLFIVLTLLANCLYAQHTILKEEFERNTQNSTSLTLKTLSSGDWYFYYTDKNYNSITECAVLKYTGLDMGYIITPLLTRPSTLSFNARTVGEVSNWLAIQKSVNGGKYTTIEKVLVSGTNYKQYKVTINEKNDDVRIKFIRTKPSPDGSNYNIILDNVDILGNDLLQVSNGTSLIENGRKISIPLEGNASSVEIPLTLTNMGNEMLKILDIETLGSCNIIGDRLTSIAPGESFTITAQITLTKQKHTEGLVLIHGNTSTCTPYLIRFEVKNVSDIE